MKELQSYLGLLNFYRRFMPDVSSMLQPLHELLRASATWSWGDAQEEAFQKCKELFTSASVLVHYRPNDPVVLSCDTSSYGVGAIPAHRNDAGWERPIAFASRGLASAVRNYSLLDKEVLAFVFGVTKFKQYLWGQAFEAVTDHEPLLGCVGRTSPFQSSARRDIYVGPYCCRPTRTSLCIVPGKTLAT